jgi:hypothetical protein
MLTEFYAKFVLALIATIVFYFFEVKSSFDKIYSLLSKNEVTHSKRILKHLLHNLNNRTNIEFAIYNSKTGLFLYIISFFLANILLLSVSTNTGKYILPFLGFIVLFSSEIYVYSKKTNIYISPSKAFWFDCIYKYGKLYFITSSLYVLY